MTLGDALGENVSMGGKLSNSGELLKLLIPSCIWKNIRGWINYSGKVTSQKILEKEMDNRGSKSTINNVVVKEQRVDGSLFINTDLMDIRCTLRGFERNRGIKLRFNTQQCWNSHVKNPSNQFDLKKIFYLYFYYYKSWSLIWSNWRWGFI